MPDSNRTDDDAQLKADMLSALSSVEDYGQKVVLLLLIRSLDNISGKLDKVLSDEAKIKHIVLNGYSEQHDSHHKFIESQMDKMVNNQHIISLIKDKRNTDGYCDFAYRKIKEEEALQISKTRIRDGLIEKVLLSIIMLIVGALSAKYLGSYIP